MNKQFAIVAILISSSIYPLNFDKEFNDLKKIAATIGSDAWDRASFENNVYTITSKATKCREEKPNNPEHRKKCDEQLRKELDQQISADGKNILKLLIADVVLWGAAKTIESATATVVGDPKAKNIADTVSTLPKLAVYTALMPLTINYTLSFIAKYC